MAQDDVPFDDVPEQMVSFLWVASTRWSTPLKATVDGDGHRSISRGGSPKKGNKDIQEHIYARPLIVVKFSDFSLTFRGVTTRVYCLNLGSW